MPPIKVEPVSPEREQSQNPSQGRMPDLSRGGVEHPKRKQTDVASGEPSEKRHKMTGPTAVSSSHPYLHLPVPSPLADLPLPVRGGRPPAQPWSKSGAAPGQLEPAYAYLWTAGQASVAWEKVYPGRQKLYKGGPFSLPFPCDRSRSECVAKRIARTNELLDNRYIHVVIGSVRSPDGRHLGFNVFLSPVSNAVKTGDLPFLRAITWAWEMLMSWYGRMLTSCEDINLASFLEESVANDLNSLGQKESAELWNEQARMYDDLAKGHVEAFKQAKQAAGQHIFELLHGSVDFEARKDNLQKWVDDTKRNPTIIKRRELAKQVWMDHHVVLSDSVAAIEEWFRPAARPANRAPVREEEEEDQDDAVRVKQEPRSPY
ncbi:hypothetical protein F5Y06DRAFT_279440 [Hypoxylon sp. FL0890]|nr:hypothetical protein F5Y06DRAFT_279440 [Hypoxylon sp. FL0890]